MLKTFLILIYLLNEFSNTNNMLADVKTFIQTIFIQIQKHARQMMRQKARIINLD